MADPVVQVPLPNSPNNTIEEEQEEEGETFPNPLDPTHLILRSETERTFLSHQHLGAIFPSPVLSALPTHEIEKMLHVFIACGMLSPTTLDERNPTAEFKVWAEKLLRKFFRASARVVQEEGEEKELLAKADLQMLQVSIFLATEAAAGKAAFEGSGDKEDEVEEGLYKTIRDGTAKEEERAKAAGVGAGESPLVVDEEVSEVVLGKLGWGLRFILGMVVYCRDAGERLEVEYISK